MTEFQLDTLGNGLRVVTVPMPQLHSAELSCNLGVGARHEPAALAGISHFLEHMLFRGTAEFPTSLELEQAFEEIGGAANASTDAESTCLFTRLHPDHLDRGIELLASMLRRPLLGELEVERRIILEEANEDLNEQGEEINPDNLTAELLWPGHPLGRPTIGSRETISRIRPADLQDYHRRFYVPGNAVLTVAGPVEHARVVAACRTWLGDWQGAALPPQHDPLPDAGGGPQSVWVHDSGSQVSLQLAFRLPGRFGPDSLALRVLRRLLAWGGSSRLMLRLREELGLTYHVDASLVLYADCGCLSIELAVSPDNLAQAVAETLAIVRRLQQVPAPKEELQRVLQAYRFSLDFSRDQPEEMTTRYGWGELVGFRRTLAQDLADLDGVSAARLQEVAARLLGPQALSAAFVGPFRQRDRREVERLLRGFGR